MLFRSFKRKAQSWYIDYIVGFLIFVIAIFFAVKYVPNLAQDDIEDIMLDSKILSDALMSTGVPSGWNEDDVSQIGVVNDSMLDTDKLNMLYAMNYTHAKSRLPVVADFVMYFNNESCIMELEGKKFFGADNANSTNIEEIFEPTHIIHTKRLLAYGGRIITMNVMTWDY